MKAVDQPVPTCPACTVSQKFKGGKNRVCDRCGHEFILWTTRETLYHSRSKSEYGELKRLLESTPQNLEDKG